MIQAATGQGKSNNIFGAKKCFCLVKPTAKSVVKYITVPGTSLKKFKVNNTYNYQRVGNLPTIWSVFLEKIDGDADILVEGHLFTIEDFNKFFMDVSEHREKRIDEILND